MVTLKENRGFGYGLHLLGDTIEHYKKKNRNVIFIGYADIDPNVYAKYNQFKMLPPHLQRYEDSVCVIKCQGEMWEEIQEKWKLEDVPEYF